ncbi:unnamed protein product [Mytilus coruscus]|uniref:Uncharacterized protein n=1 Tax=Mytilus coruscus TaxID=42192 RepID=A0A6J8AK70_MYTCO|nr:unnamed protein product [Mytilus coruscus]
MYNHRSPHGHQTTTSTVDTNVQPQVTARTPDNDLNRGYKCTTTGHRTDSKQRPQPWIQLYNHRSPHGLQTMTSTVDTNVQPQVTARTPNNDLNRGYKCTTGGQTDSNNDLNRGYKCTTTGHHTDSKNLNQYNPGHRTDSNNDLNRGYKCTTTGHRTDGLNRGQMYNHRSRTPDNDLNRGYKCTTTGHRTDSKQ